MASSLAVGALAAAALYLGAARHLHWPVIRPLLGPAFVRDYLTDPRLRDLIALMDEERVARADAFDVFWNASNTELISNRIFRPVPMNGVTRYMYRPNVKTLQFVTGASGVYRAMEMEDTPRLRGVLSRLDTRRMAAASYDRLGFRRVDPELTRDCTRRVLFLGDSFTDGVGVNDEDTFVNRYGHLARERTGLAVCPIDAGVEGYGSFEEAFVLDTYYEAFLRPSVIVVMHYVNDVDDDEAAVVSGSIGPDDPRWTRSLSFLEHMAATARDRHATLLVAAIPAFVQFRQDESRRHYQDVLRQFCERREIPFVDLYDALERSGPGSAYFGDDPHWTPAGHRVAAQALFEATRTLLR